MYDDYGNRITVPAGFKVVVDSTTSYNTNDIDVTKGIVIEDANGNQFVWIPVGTIYTDTAKTEEKIILGRYTFGTDGTEQLKQEATNYAKQEKITNNYGNSNGTHSCFEDASNNDNVKHYNAKNLRGFCLSANQNGGYYLGRYEASKDVSSNITSKATDTTYTGLSQPDASEICRKMYSSDKFESDLTNSYAYDTAIVFIQKFGEKQDYSVIKDKNDNKDKQLNIFNMAGGYFEWSTETSEDSEKPCIKRGNLNSAYDVPVSSRSDSYTNLSGYSFRPILYLK